MATERDLVVLGAGMHPWGKWGKNFVDYGLVAAKAALADADVAWRDIEFVAGADTIRNGYPGFVAGSTSPRQWAGQAHRFLRHTPHAHRVHRPCSQHARRSLRALPMSQW